VSAPSRGIALRGDEPHDGRRDPEPKGPWQELDRDGPIMSKRPGEPELSYLVEPFRSDRHRHTLVELLAICV
jgi:hypothetical protein